MRPQTEDQDQPQAMNRREHLLTILGEEGVEVAQRASKCLRFGDLEIQPGQDKSNAERLMGEFMDLLALVEMAQEEGILPVLEMSERRQLKAAKKGKVEKYLEYSKSQGTLNP